MDLSKAVAEQVENVTKTDNKLQIYRIPSLLQPTNADIKRGQLAIWDDITNNKCYLCFNHKGTIKKVELT